MIALLKAETYELQDLRSIQGGKHILPSPPSSLSMMTDTGADDSQIARYTGFEPTSDTIGPLSSKIAHLRKQSRDIATGLNLGTLTVSERRNLLDQKLQIEKTLDLLETPHVKSVVRKRDSMGHSLKPTSEVMAQPLFNDQDLDQDQSWRLQDVEPGPSFIRRPRMQKEYSIDDIGALESSVGRRERAVRRGTRRQTSDTSFRASDHLFLSTETHPSLRLLRAASSQSLSDLIKEEIFSTENDTCTNKRREINTMEPPTHKLPKGITLKKNDADTFSSAKNDVVLRGRSKLHVANALASGADSTNELQLPSNEALGALAMINLRKRVSDATTKIDSQSPTRPMDECRARNDPVNTFIGSIISTLHAELHREETC